MLGEKSKKTKGQDIVDITFVGVVGFKAASKNFGKLKMSDMSLGNSSVNFLRKVGTLPQLFSSRFKDGEEIRVCSSVPLRGDFDRAAVRIAQILDKWQHNKPIEERRGSYSLCAYDIKSSWRYLKARYHSQGGMTQDERYAFDTILGDLALSESYSVDSSRVRVMYSNVGTIETTFHRDYNGNLRLLRAYNHSAMVVTDRYNIFSMGDCPNSYSVFDEKRVIPIQIGDYTLHRMMDVPKEDMSCEHGAYHRATVKEPSLTPRLLLCCD